PTPCVGRDAELDRLTALFAASVREPRAQVALVTAPPGVGKSRLRQEVIRRIREQSPGVEVWMGRGAPMGAGSAFALIAEAVRRCGGAAGPRAARRGGAGGRAPPRAAHGARGGGAGAWRPRKGARGRRSSAR